MTTILPTGLTHLLESNGANLVLNTNDFTNSSGKTGPLVLKLTNSSDATVAVVSYDNSFTPPVPVTYTNITGHSNYGNPILDITVDPANNIPVATVVGDNTNSYYLNVTVQVNGDQIGGTAGLVSFNITGVVNPDAPSMITELTYTSGYVPAGGGANLPTPGTPTKVFTIPPLVSEIVQIPSSENGSTTLIASGANVYVTPVQIV